MSLAKLSLTSLACALGLGVSGCASPPAAAPIPADYVVLLPSTHGTVGQVFVKGSKGEQTLTAAGSGTALNGATPPAPVPQDQLMRDFGAALGARPALPEQFYLYFETGGARLTKESQALIPVILENAKNHGNADVSVIGHTDTVGKAEANALLAYQRAVSMTTLLRERGLQAATVTIESHGESNLLVTTPDETPEPRNRRVEIIIR